MISPDSEAQTRNTNLIFGVSSLILNHFDFWAVCSNWEVYSSKLLFILWSDDNLAEFRVIASQVWNPKFRFQSSESFLW